MSMDSLVCIWIGSILDIYMGGVAYLAEDLVLVRLVGLKADHARIR